jgi:hypothetical protein
MASGELINAAGNDLQLAVRVRGKSNDDYDDDTREKSVVDDDKEQALAL